MSDSPDPNVPISTRPAPTLPSGGMGVRALRSSLLILLARIVSRLVALVTVVAVGETLRSKEFGRMQTAVTCGTVIATIADLGYSSLFVREGARHPELINRYLNSVLSVKVMLFALSGPLLAAVLWALGLGGFTLSIFVMIVVASYSLLLRNTLYALQRLKFEILEIVPESLVLLGLVVLGASLGQGATFYVWAYTGSYLFACAYFMIVLLTTHTARPTWEFDSVLLRSWLRAALPLGVTFVLTTLYFKADVPLLYALRGAREVGWYQFAYKPFEALLFIPVTLRTVIFPVISVYHHAAGERVLDASARLFKALAMLGWPCTVGIVLLAPQIIDTLDPGHIYPMSAAALRILGVAVAIMFVDNTFAATLNAIDRQKAFAMIVLTGFVVNVLLNLVLIPRFGYLGASWAVVVTEAWLVAIGWLTLRKYLGVLPVWQLCWRVLLAGTIMGGFVAAIHPLGRLHLVLVIAAGACIYGVSLLAVGAVTREERQLVLEALPGFRGRSRQR